MRFLCVPKSICWRWIVNQNNSICANFACFRNFSPFSSNSDHFGCREKRWRPPREKSNLKNPTRKKIHNNCSMGSKSLKTHQNVWKYLKNRIPWPEEFEMPVIPRKKSFLQIFFILITWFSDQNLKKS